MWDGPPKCHDKSYRNFFVLDMCKKYRFLSAKTRNTGSKKEKEEKMKRERHVNGWGRKTMVAAADDLLTEHDPDAIGSCEHK